jgi:pimeloyl-ACP methyl ester carboxylesterase
VVCPAVLCHLGIGSTAVLGYSQGGAIAQQLVLDHPRRCDRLVLACTYAFNMSQLARGSTAASRHFSSTPSALDAEAKVEAKVRVKATQKNYAVLS